MVNYCVKSIRNAISVQEVLEIPNTLLGSVEMEQGRANKPPNTPNILRETGLQHLPVKYQQGRG